MTSVFLTGGTGFIGSNLLELLIERGEDVTVLTRKEENRGRLEGKGAEVIVGNINNEDLILNCLEDHEIVFHLAALYKFGGRPRSEFHSTNVEGTRNILESAEEHENMVIYCSTVAHFGPTGAKIRDEDFTKKFPYPSQYARSKGLAHKLCLDYIEDGGRIKIVSPGAVFGSSDGSQLGKLVKSYLGEEITVLPDTDDRFTFVHVEDIAEAFLKVWKKGKIGREYIIGDKILTLQNYFEKISEIANLDPPPTIPSSIVKLISVGSELISKVSRNPPAFPMEGLKMLQSDWAFSSKRAREELGWEPEPFEKRLKKYVRKIRDEKHHSNEA